MNFDDDLATLLAEENQTLPLYGEHVSLVRRTNNTVFPTISNRNTDADPPSGMDTTLPRAFGWLSPKGLFVRRLAPFLTFIRPITGALSGFGRVMAQALPKGTRHALSIAGE